MNKEMSLATRCQKRSQIKTVRVFVLPKDVSKGRNYSTDRKFLRQYPRLVPSALSLFLFLPVCVCMCACVTGHVMNFKFDVNYCGPLVGIEVV